jgi:hypothetical protein
MLAVRRRRMGDRRLGLLAGEGPLHGVSEVEVLKVLDGRPPAGMASATLR